MYYYQATIQYAGTNYAGFQWQPNLKTIQQEINHALSSLLNAQISTMAASRTDTGVHAFNQVVKITTHAEINLNESVSKLNQILPDDIEILSINSCSGDFKPNVKTTSKEYLYLFTNKPKSIDIIDQPFVANFGKALDIKLINQTLPLFQGEHNFHNFYSTGSNVTSTIRLINSIDLNIINPHELFHETIFTAPLDLHACYQLKINGNGFLKQMIRHIVSSLWMVGTKKISPDQLQELIDGKKIEQQLWKVAPPNGLFLNKITFS